MEQGGKTVFYPLLSTFYKVAETHLWFFRMGLDLVPFRVKYLVVFELGKKQKPLKFNDLSGFVTD
jgi:hypothetical protein